MPASDQQPLRPALTIAEAADLLGVTRQHIDNLCRRGVLRRFKIGRCARLRRDDVMALIGGELNGDDTAA